MLPLPRYEIKKRMTIRGMRYRFNLLAENGEIVATSELYTTKAKAKEGIESVKANAGADVIDLTGEA